WEDYLSGKNENTVTQEDADEFNANYSKALGALLLIETNLDELGNEYTRGVFVEREASVPGRHINRASVSASELTGVPEIHFNLDGTGGTLMARATGRHKRDQPDPRRLGIVRTDTRIIGTGEKARAEQFKTLVSAPSINGRIATRGMIEGIDSYEEATTISSALNNPLENPVRIIESRTVDPSLGRRSIEQGYKAAIWGLIVVAVFMLIYYLLSGVMANIALSLNIVILLGVLCWFDATLTLPGIAGVVLTIGMAVDANVLIYERIREELNLGKSLKGAITSGYDKAFGTIFDANITTMIASLILIYMGKGPVKGFGYTLTIGIITSMFTALVATRVVMDFLLNAGIIGSDNSKRAMHLRPTAGLPKFDFLKYATPA
ncbi:MAG TPA: protein translocase subunit SecD, partial [Verrucomicrobiales bacterium]|nr:protein translocase subunit SecD [Verrucomicrobiales bacterium]